MKYVVWLCCLVLLAGCGGGGQGADGGTASGVIEGDSVAQLSINPGESKYVVGVVVNSSYYPAREVGGLALELEVPEGVEPEVLSGVGVAGVYQLASPITLAPACFSPESMVVSAWVPEKRKLKIAVVTSVGMVGFGRCIAIDLPLAAGAVSVAAASRAAISEVALSRNGMISSGDVSKITVGQAVEVR